MNLKKAFIVDWLDKYGGAERVISSIQKVVSFDITYTLINIMNQEDVQKIYPIKKPIIKETSLKYLGKKFRFFFFVFHHYISKIKVDPKVDLIISSSHAVAKGIRKSNPKQVHISYFQARNFNYIWDDSALFFGKFKPLFYPLIFLLRKIDIKQSKNPDYIISNSYFIKDWVKKIYNRDSVVIYPPVYLENFPLEARKEDYYVVVGRVVHVKKFDIVVKAFNKSGKKLIVIGDGDQLNYLKRIASDNITFTGFLSGAEVSSYIQKAKAFIQVGIEGFGIAPIEAQSCGTPVIAFAYGGVLETVIDKITGVYFYEQSEKSLSEAINLFERLEFDPLLIRENTKQFSETRFESELKKFIDGKCHTHFLG